MGGYPNSFHFFGFAGQAGNTFQPPLCFVKGSEFSGNAEVETEEDKGHTGSRSLLIGEDRVSGQASPDITDKLRLGLGLEDYFYHLTGKMTEEQLGTKTVHRRYTIDELVELPKVSYIHGYNAETEDARGFKNGQLNELGIKITNKEAPTINPKYNSDFPMYGITNPTITFPNDLPRFFGAKDLKVNIGDPGVLTPANDLGCITDGSLTFSNNLEIADCVNMAIDEIDNDAGDFGVEGSMTLKYNATNATLEREWATGSKTGTRLTVERFIKSLQFVWTGSKIETVAGSPAVDYNNMLSILMPNVDIKKVKPDESGDGSKKIAVDFKATDVTVDIYSTLNALHTGV